jgi:hypothetical protein
VPEINILAVVVAAIASFIASVIWYAIFGDAMARLQEAWRGAKAPDQPQALQMAVFFGVQLVIAVAVAVLIDLVDTSGPLPAAGLGLLLWVGFSATQWAGSIAGEGVPPRLAAIHAGDWLAHLLIISIIVGIWR